MDRCDKRVNKQWNSSSTVYYNIHLTFDQSPYMLFVIDSSRYVQTRFVLADLSNAVSNRCVEIVGIRNTSVVAIGVDKKART